MNKLYGMLVDGPDAGELHYRNTAQDFVDNNETRVLRPQSTDKSYLQFCADQLCRLCAEVFPDKLAELDPENSYAYPSAGLAAKDTVVYGLPPAITVTVFDKLVSYPFVSRTAPFFYDGVDNFTFDNKTIAWNDGTGIFSYQGFNIAFTGVAPGPFKGTITFTRKPTRDLVALAKAIAAFQGVIWDPDFELYRDSTLLTQRIAAFTLNTLKRYAQ